MKSFYISISFLLFASTLLAKTNGSEKAKYDEESSQALSQSFSTVPLGRTNIGFKTVSETQMSEFEESEKLRQFQCTNEKKNCQVEPEKPKPQKRAKLKNCSDCQSEYLLQ